MGLDEARIWCSRRGLMLFFATVIAILPMSSVSPSRVPDDDTSKETSHHQNTSLTSVVGPDTITAEDFTTEEFTSVAAETQSLRLPAEGATGANNSDTVFTGGDPQGLADAGLEALDIALADPAGARNDVELHVALRVESDADVSPPRREPMALTTRRSLVSSIRSRMRGWLPRSDHPQAQQPTPVGLNRYVLLLVYWLYTAVTAGCFYGWPGVSSLLLRQDAFAHLCGESDPRPCARQQAAVASLFSVGCICGCVMGGVGGALCARLGPRAAASLGQVLNIAGWILLAVSSADFRAHAAAISLIGAAIQLNVLPLLTVRGLFPGCEDSIMMLLGAAFTISTVVPRIIFSLADDWHLGPQRAIFIYVLGLLPTFPLIMGLLPKSDFALTNTAEQEPPTDPSTSVLLNGSREHGLPRSRVRDRMVRAAHSCLRLFRRCHVNQLLSVPFALVTLYRSICNIGAGFFHQSARGVLPAEVYDAFSYILPLGCISTVAMGLAAARYPVFPLAAAVSLAGALMYLLPLCTSDRSVLYLSPVLMSFFASCFSAQHLSLVEILFGPRLFPVIAGWTVMLSGLIGGLSSVLYEHLTVRLLGGDSFLVRVALVVAFCLQWLWLYLMRAYKRTE